MTPQQLSSRDLKNYIDAKGIDAVILPMDAQTPTVSAAARALGVATDLIIKSLVFSLPGEAVLVINNGLNRVDRRLLANYLEVGRKRVKFADPDQALAITGYVVGSMPPFGHRQAMRTIVDTNIAGLEMVYGGGGRTDAMLRLTPSELIRVTGAEVTSISC